MLQLKETPVTFPTFIMWWNIFCEPAVASVHVMAEQHATVSVHKEGHRVAAEGKAKTTLLQTAQETIVGHTSREETKQLLVINNRSFFFFFKCHLVHRACQALSLISLLGESRMTTQQKSPKSRLMHCTDCCKGGSWMWSVSSCTLLLLLLRQIVVSSRVKWAGTKIQHLKLVQIFPIYSTWQANANNQRLET